MLNILHLDRLSVNDKCISSKTLFGERLLNIFNLIEFLANVVAKILLGERLMIIIIRPIKQPFELGQEMIGGEMCRYDWRLPALHLRAWTVRYDRFFLFFFLLLLFIIFVYHLLFCLLSIILCCLLFCLLFAFCLLFILFIISCYCYLLFIYFFYYLLLLFTISSSICYYCWFVLIS